MGICDSELTEMLSEIDKTIKINLKTHLSGVLAWNMLDS